MTVTADPTVGAADRPSGSAPDPATPVMSPAAPAVGPLARLVAETGTRFVLAVFTNLRGKPCAKLVPA
ncbi:MAG: type III glutamate--ammonia ligase, partial [Dietzia sp.]|nr:type III glutamate--ammonia ligase [Dietzia sp.]